MMDIIRLLRFCKFVHSNSTFKIRTGNIPCLNHAHVCFFMHGTSGFSKNCLNYMKVLHSLGFTIIAPDHNAYHHYLCTKFKENTFCGRHLHFNTNVSFAQKNKKLYQYVAHFRKTELETCFNFFRKFIDLQNTIAFGVSEGAIAVSLARVPCAKFICSYSIERNYFTQKYPVIRLQKYQKIVQIIGTKDEFFGKQNSIASKLKSSIAGHGKHTLEALSKKYSIYLLKNQPHSLLHTNKSNIKQLIKQIIYSHFGAKQKRISPKFATLYFKISG